MLIGSDEEKKPEASAATLEIAPRQAETLMLARQLGTLSLPLHSLLDASKVSEDDDRPEPASALILERIGARREHPLTALTADVDVHVCDRLAPHRTHKGKLVSG